MASITVYRGELFPPDTVVGLYPFNGVPSSQEPGAPTTSPVQSATVASDGSLSFSGVTEGRYRAYAFVAGLHRFLTLTLSEPEDDGDGGVGPQGPAGPAGPQGPLGPEGSDGTGFNWRGTYSGAATYQVSDVVYSAGVTYIATQVLTGVAPPDTGWDIFPIEGPAGPQGPAGPSGSGFINVKQAPYNATGNDVTDDTTALQNAINDGISQGVPVFLPKGSYRVTSQLVAQMVSSSNGLQMSGFSADTTTIRRSTAGGILKIARQGSSQSERQSGFVEQITFQGASARPHDGSIAVQIDGVRLFRVRDCRANNIDVGFDIVNNGFGSTFDGLTSNSEQVNVGILLRGAYPSSPFNAMSGSDINITDCWIRGHRAGVWMEGNAGGYHIWGGQLGGGGATSPTSRDDLGGLTMGPTYFSQTTVAAEATAGATSLSVTDGTKLFSNGMLLIKPAITSDVYSVVTYTGKTGNSLTGIPASGFGSIGRTIAAAEEIRQCVGPSNVILYSVSFEGAGKKHLIRGFGSLQGFGLHDCSFHAPSGNAVRSVIKLDGPSPGQVLIDGAMPSGAFSEAVPILINGPITTDFHIEERATRGGTDAGFAGGVLQNFATRPMLSYSGIETNTFATFWERMYWAGVGLKWVSGALHRSIDSTLAAGDANWYPITGRTATVTWDPPSIAASEFASTTVTLDGVAVGDLCVASSSVVLPDGMYLQALATATNTVRVTLFNPPPPAGYPVEPGYGAVDLGSTTIKVKRLV